MNCYCTEFHFRTIGKVGCIMHDSTSRKGGRVVEEEGGNGGVEKLTLDQYVTHTKSVCN